MPTRFAAVGIVTPMLLLSLVLGFQEPFPRADADPEGTVVDELGAPVAGAEVALLGEFSDQGFGLAMAQILARHPLPVTRADRDGHFVLPLTPEQRSLVSSARQERATPCPGRRRGNGGRARTTGPRARTARS